MVSPILEEAYEIITDYYGDEPPQIKTIARGCKFVGVQLSNMNVGFSLNENDWPQYFPLLSRESYKNLPEVYALAKLACEGEKLEICYGVAAMNALSLGMLQNSKKYELLTDTDLLKMWGKHMASDTIIGMVGYMYPLVEALLRKCAKIKILDKHALNAKKSPILEGVEIIDSADGLRDAEILIATGSSLIYHSTEDIIANSQNAVKKAVVGPSVTLPPEPFWDRGVDFIGGTLGTVKYFKKILDEDVQDCNVQKKQKKSEGALMFGKKTGIRKIGLLKEK